MKSVDPGNVTAEFVGTAFLLIGVVGSGIMAENLTDDAGLQLLQNAFATAGILVALILAIGAGSGAHFNPVVTIARTFSDTFAGIKPGSAPGFIIAQFIGLVIALGLIRVMYPAVDD